MKHIYKIIRFTSELKGYYFVISILSVITSLMTLALPMLSGWAIDEIKKGTNANIVIVVWIAVGIFALDAGGTLINNINGYLGDQMSAKLQLILSRRYYEHLLTLSQKYFDTELSGKIINRLNRSINQITNFMQMLSNNFLQFIFSTIFALLIVLFYSWQIALLLFSLYPIYSFMTIKSSRRWQDYQKKKNLHLDIGGGRFAESINQIKVVKSFLQEKRELNFLSKHYQIMVDTNKPQSKYWHTKDVYRRLVLNIVFFAVYSFIFVQGAQGHFTPGQSVALILYAMQIRIPIFTISFLVENTQRAIADSKDYFEILNIVPEINDNPKATDLKVTKGDIELKNVDFSYDKQKVLSDISFKIESDTKVALVGESGEGKTTITSLLMRLYQPDSGQIFIDNQDIAAVTQASLRQNIGTVFQESSLFSGTIKENIAYSNSSAKFEDIKRAAKAANADEFINSFKKGYDTPIGERGLKLSGGQKQRIAIARALLKNAPILILDEATSSLDSNSERMVQQALHRLMKGRTTIIIAHRLSTIQSVDKIITLKNGRIDEVGTPKQLATSGGIYEHLLRLQNNDNDEVRQQLKQYEMNEK